MLTDDVDSSCCREGRIRIESRSRVLGRASERK